MQIVPAPAFQLPDGWVLEVRPRGNSPSGIYADKYYYEPHTGRQFRSLSSVKRYLNGDEEPPRRKAPRIHQQGALQFPTYNERIAYNGKLWMLEELEAARRPGARKNAGPATVQHRASSLLPDGWIVEEVPRRCGFRTDTYFIEPMTRRKFRSVPEVQRYLTAADCDDDDDEYVAKFKPLNMILPNPTAITTPPLQGTCPRKETPELVVNPENFDMFNLPHQITWILSSSSSSSTSTSTSSASGQEYWVPFLEASRIPDHVKQVWQDTFFLGMTGSRWHRIPQLTMGE